LCHGLASLVKLAIYDTRATRRLQTIRAEDDMVASHASSGQL